MRCGTSSISGKSRLGSGFALLLAVLLVAVATGCGDDERADGSAGETAQTNSAATTSTGSENGGPTVGTGQSGQTGQTEQTQADPDSGDDESSGAGDEDAARTPVMTAIKNGTFTAATPGRVHVPAFIAIELEVNVADERSYRIAIKRDGESRPGIRTVAFGENRFMIEGLRPGRRLTVSFAGRDVVVVADAEPGP